MNITKYWNKDELNRKTNEYNKWIKKGWKMTKKNLKKKKNKKYI